MSASLTLPAIFWLFSYVSHFQALFVSFSPNTQFNHNLSTNIHFIHKPLSARLADQYVAHKATNKYWNTGIGLVALKATGVPKSDPKIDKIQK